MEEGCCMLGHLGRQAWLEGRERRQRVVGSEVSRVSRAHQEAHKALFRFLACSKSQLNHGQSPQTFLNDTR